MGASNFATQWFHLVAKVLVGPPLLPAFALVAIPLTACTAWFATLWAHLLAYKMLTQRVLAVWRRLHYNNGDEERAPSGVYIGAGQLRNMLRDQEHLLAYERHNIRVLTSSKPAARDDVDSHDDSEVSPASTAPSLSPLHGSGRQLSLPPASPQHSAGASSCAEVVAPPSPKHQHINQDATPASTPAGSSMSAGIGPNPAMDGSWLANCVEERRLGEGAFATVHQVLVTPPSGRAFRAARKRMPAGPVTAIMLAAEVEVLRMAADCPHLVQLLDARSSDGYHEVLLELAAGGTVEEELATSVMVHGRPLSDDRIRDIAVSCLHGLMFLHRRGVCVRDIKPENLLVRSPGGEVVLADMGHATRSDSSGRLQQQGWEGSVPYIAPEAAPRVLCQQPQQSGSRLPPGCQRVGGAKAAKRPVLTTKVDVYALGKSLYRCAGWGCPLKNWEAGISAELRQFLDHLMEPNAAKRPTASRALEHPFLQQQQQQA